MLDRTNFRGIYVIVTTPFTDALEIDEPGLRRTLKFCFDAGVHGVVSTANASEVGYLSEAERRRVAEIVVVESRGKCPAIVGVSTSHYRLSKPLARHAEEIGADGVMAMPPTFHTATPAEVKTFYRELAAATKLPIVLQNAAGPGATPMGAQFIAELTAELPTARFVKEETAYPAQLAGDILRLAGERLEGVMGGRGGRTIMEEVRHGMCGTMPACEIADVHVALWRAIEAKDEVKARRIFQSLLPLIDFEGSYGMPMMKEVLKMRGVIDAAAWRQTGYRSLDAAALEEAATIMDGLADYMLPAYSHRQSIRNEKAK